MTSVSAIKSEFAQYGKGTITLTIKNGIAHILLSNPSKRNALSPLMMTQFHSVVQQLKNECLNSKSIYGLVLNGDKNTFCSGFDLHAASTRFQTQEMGSKMCLLMHDTFKEFYSLPLISIAAIEGYALGGGAELASWCDFRIMSNDAVLRFLQLKMGVTFGWV